MAKKLKSLLNAECFHKPAFWLLLAVVLLGGGFRFYHLNWDFQHSFHPDERNILGQTSSIQAGDGYRVKFFAYGQLPVYLYRATGEVVSTPAFYWNLFRGHDDAAQDFYWLSLAILAGLALWFFPREKWHLPSFGVSAFLWVCVLFFKFSPVFSAWSNQLDGPGLKAVTFVLVGVASFGLSAAAAEVFGWEWTETPFYAAAGATFLLGALPAFLPEAIGRALAVLAFLILIAGLGLWWAWVSRWGRTVLALLSLWAALASLNHMGHQYTGYGECMLIGRWWAAVFSTATIGAVYLFVKRAYRNSLMALVAAASFAFAVVSIEQAHYCITESFITLMFVVIALFSYEISQKGSWKNYLLAGAAFGFAMAAKTSSLYYVFILVTAHLVLLSQKGAKEWEKERRKQGDQESLYAGLAGLLMAVVPVAFIGAGFKFRGVFQDLFGANPTEAKVIWAALFMAFSVLGLLFFAWGVKEFKVVRAQMPYWVKLAAAGGLAFLIFCLLSPWSLLDFQGFMGSQNYEWHVVSIADACYVLQFKDTLHYLFQLQNLMSVELWWPLGIAVVAGMAWVLVRFLRALAAPKAGNYLLPAPFSRNKGFHFSLPDLLVLCWFIPYFGFIGSWNTKFIRYMVPLIPAFCIFGARLLTDLFAWVKSKNLLRFLKPALLAVVLGPSFFYSAAYMHVYRFPHPWIESSVWIFKHIPPGSMILKEAWDDGLPTGVTPQEDPRLEKPMGPGDYRQQDITVYELHGYPTDDTDIKKNYYANILQQGDYISIASKKLWYTLTACTPEFKPRGYNAYPVTSRYYRCLWSGLLGYKMVGEFHNFPSLFGWSHPDDMAEESFSVYDHPRVYIFKKVETVPPARIVQLLSSDDYVKGINRDLMRAITPDNVGDFIAERQKYLQDHGLWARLDAASAPTPQPTPVPAQPKARHPKHPALQAAATPETLQVSPTPEAKVEAPVTVPPLPDLKTLQTLQSLAEHPVVESNVMDPGPAPEEGLGYQLRAWFTWLLALVVLGWLAFPLTLRLLAPFPSGAYSLSKILGFFLYSWIIWFFTSFHVGRFTLASCWAWFLGLAFLSAFAYWKDSRKIKLLYARWGGSWKIQEGAFVAAFALFSLAKIYMPHIHDPIGEGYNGGGEAGMDFGFLSSIVRGETFPPQNMWMAGQPIGYPYYFGHLMMGILTKFLGLAPAVTYNLALISLFALIFSGAFGLAFGLSGRLLSGWVAGFLCAAAGNPAGAWQYLDAVRQCFVSGNLGPLLTHVYDFWGPTRVIPNSINEFPYFSVLYGDMHAHTLAMPFSMLLIGVIASLYLAAPGKPWDLKRDALPLGAAGLLLGGLAFLNTWDVITWLLLLGLALLIRTLSGLKPKVLDQGLGIVFACLLASLTLLGWWSYLAHTDPQVLGGQTPYLGAALLAGGAGGWIFLFARKKTKGMATRLLAVAAGLAGALLGAFLTWAPFFTHFVPQQSQVLWVTPSLRTSLTNFFGIYGLFLTVLAFCFGPAYPKEIAGWMVKAKWGRFSLESLLEKLAAFFEALIRPQGPVTAMMALGGVSLVVIWGASWAHWADPPDKAIFPLILATAGAAFLALAVYFRKQLVFWMAAAAVGLLWVSLLVLHALRLSQDASPVLGLGLFSVLWLAAFFHLGTAVKVFRDRNLSFAYLLVALFFFILAGLEVFAMKEYLGGEWMRNNSLFKFGINAWTLASVAFGVFLPRIFGAFGSLLKVPKKEAPVARALFTAAAGLLLFTLLSLVLPAFVGYFDSPLPYLTEMVLFTGFFVWNWMEKWLNREASIAALAVVLFFLFLAVLPSAGYGTALAFLERTGKGLGTTVLLPALLSFMILAAAYLVWERRKDLGRRMLFQSWRTLLLVFGFMSALYPMCATTRKCHDFLDVFRRQWVSYVEPPTLDGLAYLPKANPYDAAAIRFLNEHIPDQPCLAEFVGEGYNSWGSRFSIFTGIPALMGWDGHVREWLTGRPGMDADINQRFQATEQIFRTADPRLAKRYLDAYGVRLVMVGTVERYGVPGRKGGYPAEGLAKFQGFLPLVYKNPEVEIYYNPPSAN